MQLTAHYNTCFEVSNPCGCKVGQQMLIFFSPRLLLSEDLGFTQVHMLETRILVLGEKKSLGK